MTRAAMYRAVRFCIMQGGASLVSSIELTNHAVSTILQDDIEKRLDAGIQQVRFAQQDELNKAKE